MSKVSFLLGRLCFCVLTVVLHSFSIIDVNAVEQLAVCGAPSDSVPRSLIFVSTLDGKVSALNAAKNGEKQWSLDFGKGSMLSSNIHRRELNNNGQWVRLIPSLKGRLYKFDGENLESIPVTTDQLLYSSFRYSDDLVFSGGKETRSYGVSTRTGQILYECNINGCNNNTDGENYIEQEILIIQHLQQTVRAVEPRSGLEKWNFSVGQHELSIVSNENIYCQTKIETKMQEIEIKVIIPEGLIWAVNKNSPNEKLWQYKFDSPIVTIWQEKIVKDANQKGLSEINLFNNSQWTWGSEFSLNPSIYLGMHDRQLYIQENTQFYKSLEPSSKVLQQSRFPWHPYPAIDTTLMTVPANAAERDNNEISFQSTDAQSTTALSVLYNSEYINGNGFYLYSKEHLELNKNLQWNDTNSKLSFDELKVSANDIISISGNYNSNFVDDDTPVQIIIVSLWYWWKEVLIISITTALLLNFMLTQRLLNATTTAKDAVLPPLIVERHIETKSVNQTTNEKENVDNFKSRYLTDFEPVDCLGKGGYGVVFEAKNKIDDCNYAIKRIALPNSQDSRERVMREVKALAKLDHCNIVRYFNAWLECPPSGWQEEHDRQWICKKNFFTSEFSSDLSQSKAKANSSTCIDILQLDQSSVDSACEAYALNHVNNIDDSYIVFESTEKRRNEENFIDIGDSTTATSVDMSCRDNGSTKSNNSKTSESFSSDENDEKLSKGSSKKHRKRKKSLFSLNLNGTYTNKKSAKMFLYIQMQLCQRLSLREWLKQQSSPRDFRRVLSIFHQIVDAVEYVHLQGLIHRDLKPSNIFFAFDDKIKIGDFGLVTAMTEGYKEAHTPLEQNENITFQNCLHTARVGTHLYMSPEQMNGQVYNYKVDIYSLGIILFELLTPFITEMERVVALTNLRKLDFPNGFDVNYPAEHILLKMMLDEDPKKRPTTLGIKGRPPLLNYEKENGISINESSKWHFELPQLSKHSSVTGSSSSGDSWENVS